MTSVNTLSKSEIQTALTELDGLAKGEYGTTLEALLLSPDPNAKLRAQRLVGIALKRKFANPTGRPAYSATGARRAWPWPDLSDSLVPIEGNAGEELALLEQLRMPGPWNERKPLTGTAEDKIPISWSEFKDDANNERGLFKILALFAVDQFNKRQRKTLKEYLGAPESKSFEAGLDLATLLFDWSVTPHLAAFIGVPVAVVGVGLVGMQFGYRLLTDPNEDRVGDSFS